MSIISKNSLLSQSDEDCSNRSPYPDSNENFNTFDDDEHEDSIDIFQEFNQQAEKRLRTLLHATEDYIYATETTALLDVAIPRDARYQGIPVPDHIRQLDPPIFSHWQEKHPYLRVVGNQLAIESCNPGIQILPITDDSTCNTTKLSDNDTTIAINEPLIITGRKVSQWSRDEHGEDLSEEIIAIDGVIEEILAIDCPDESNEEKEDTFMSPTVYSHDMKILSVKESRIMESIDQLTLDLFDLLIEPAIISVFQHILHISNNAALEKEKVRREKNQQLMEMEDEALHKLNSIICTMPHPMNELRAGGVASHRRTLKPMSHNIDSKCEYIKDWIPIHKQENQLICIERPTSSNSAKARKKSYNRKQVPRRKSIDLEKLPKIVRNHM